MPHVTLPRVLQPATQRLALDVDGTTVEEALRDLLDQEPNLRVHLFDEQGDLRPHVSCFVDGTSTRLADRTQVVDSAIDFVQAVSGG